MLFGHPPPGGGGLVTSGGRVLAVTGVGRSVGAALSCAYGRLDRSVAFAGLHCRRDIGGRALPPHAPLRVGVLGSTRGTDLDAIYAALDKDKAATAAGRLDPSKVVVALVVSDQDPDRAGAAAGAAGGGPGADSALGGSSEGILAKARARGVPALHLPYVKGTGRAKYDATVTAALRDAGVDLVLCIGWMRILSPAFCAAWPLRCLNVHPSLLPDFAGGMDGDVHAAVLAAGKTETGCTLHWVTAEVDGGPVLLQKKCKVDSQDTPQSLKAKVQALEGAAFVELLGRFQRDGLPDNTEPLLQAAAAAAAAPVSAAEPVAKKARSSAGGGGGGEVVSYKDAGVDIDAGNLLVERIKPACRATARPGCDGDLGGFGGLFDLSAGGYGGSDTLLVGATDGVGTKLKVAQLAGYHGGVGIDLVAMCVNDLLVCGAEPLFFLDYFATGALSVEHTAAIVEGIAAGCVQAGCGLVGGETAEMPSMYGPGEYDLGGFAVGAVRKPDLLPADPRAKPALVVAPGDVLLGLASSGVHSNGFSLVRKLVDRAGLSYADPAPFATDGAATTLGEALLTPTRIYVKSLLPLVRAGKVKAMAHITGGGLPENIPRVLPPHLAAEVELGSPGLSPLPPVFAWLRAESNLPPQELTTTFNCGVGMVVAVAPEVAQEVAAALAAAGETVTTLGRLVAIEPGSPQVVLKGELH